jgi:DHA1 family inner membrane transport protein
VTAFFGLVLVEAPLLAWSERVSARWFSAASLLALALSTLGAAFAHGALGLAFCLALYGPAAGCSLSVAEGVLVESAGASRERTMARVTLAAALGDLAVPVLLGACAWLGIGWRAVFVIAGVVALVLAIAHAGSRELERAVPKDEDDDGESPTIREALRVAFGTRPLLGWSFAGVLVGLLDEVLVAFAAVHLAGLSPLMRSVALACWIGGGLVGLAWLERRIEHVSPRRVLLVTTTIAAVALALLSTTQDPVLAPVLLAIVGSTSSMFHPLVKARAYASLPGRPALVNAVASAVVPLDALAPIALGAIAFRFGVPTVVALLALAPVGVGLMAWRERA